MLKMEFIARTIKESDYSLISVNGNVASGKSAFNTLLTELLSDIDERCLYLGECSFQTFSMKAKRTLQVNGKYTSTLENVYYKQSNSYLASLNSIKKLIKHHKPNVLIIDFDIVNLLLDEYSNIPRALLTEKISKKPYQEYRKFTSYQKRIILSEELRDIARQQKIKIMITESTAIRYDDKVEDYINNLNFVHSHVFDLIIHLRKSKEQGSEINPLTKKAMHKYGFTNVKILKNRFGYEFFDNQYSIDIKI